MSDLGESDLAPTAGVFVSGLAGLVTSAVAAGAALPLTGAVVTGAVAVVPAGAVVLSGAAVCWAKALSGKIAKVEATSRLEMRVMVVFLITGGMVRFRLRRIRPHNCDASAMTARPKHGERYK
jgi:hypothetical protein